MIKTFPTLYSQDQNNNIRIWFMEQKHNLYRTHSGVKGGQLVISEWSTAEPKNVGKKNETSATEQATAEIEAKYKKQLKSGYHKHEEDAALGTAYVEPMLAETYGKITKNPVFKTEKWGIQCKFNGNRCVATKSGLYTRRGEKYIAVPHIEEALKPFFEKYPDAILDGELFNNELRQKLNEIAKLIRKTKNVTPDVIEKSKLYVKFYIYDGYNFPNLDQSSPYEDRKQWIDENVIPTSEYLAYVKTEIVDSEEHMMKLFNNLVSDFQEGAILRKMDSPYENKRSKYLLKVKPEDDDEAKILAITDGDGNWKGAATNVTLQWNGITFDGVFVGKYEVREEILKDKDNWIGKEVTFKYMGLTGLGTPNSARVDPDNCFKTDR
jgi:ATP-dependent DNA ligase